MLAALFFFLIILTIIRLNVLSISDNDLLHECNIHDEQLLRKRTSNQAKTLKCSSITALANYFTQLNVSSTHTFNAIELNCASDFTSVDYRAIKLLQEFDKTDMPEEKVPHILSKLSIHNCGQKSLEIIDIFSKVKLLNLTKNQITYLPWTTFQSVQIESLDLRNNFLECSRCKNRWIYDLSRQNIRQRYMLNFDSDMRNAWDIRYIFPFMPRTVFVDNTSFSGNDCSYLHCAQESVIFDPRVVNTTLGSPLRLQCRMNTADTVKAHSTAVLSPFQWMLSKPKHFSDSTSFYDHELDFNRNSFVMGTMLNDTPSMEKKGSLESKYYIEWEDDNLAVLKKNSTSSDDLGYVACKCITCDIPTFSISEVRFNVNITAVIKDHSTNGDSQLIVHGYPLNNIRLAVSRLEDNFTEEQILSEQQLNSFYNDSFFVKYQKDHSYFFLKYYLIYIHECIDCSHTVLEGDYMLRVCTEIGECIEILHKLFFRQHDKSYPSSIQNDSNVKRPSPFTYVALLVVMICFLTFVALAAMGSSNVRQKNSLIDGVQKAGWKFKRRRISRNTNRTEETSIPLEDSLSNTGLSTSYSFVAQHVPVIEPNELIIKYKIGRGAFGEVFTAEWMSRKETVAVKTLHNALTIDEEMDKEAALLAKLDHDNVLRLYGVSKCNGKVALVMEMMNQGDLKSYLKKREPRCDNYSQFPPALLQSELINIGVQVCTGLSYLASQQIVHRDLAARNCLVSGDSDAIICSPAFRPPIAIKISDFGMSRRLYSDAEYYRMHDSKTALPVRWLPPECLSFGKFTHQSDMWSFGVTLFEIFTYGDMPFGNLSNGEVLTAVVSGIRPEVPPKCSNSIGEIMKQCWIDEPTSRINADDALIKLKSLL